MALGSERRILGGGERLSQRILSRPVAVCRVRQLRVQCRVTYAPTTVTPVSASPEVPETENCTACGDLLQPWLTNVKAHEASLTAGILVEDACGGTKLFVSASMDKTVAAWRLKPSDDPAAAPYVEVQKIVAPGAPLFSLVRAMSQRLAKGDRKAAPAPLLLYCGNAAKEVVAWEPFKPEFQKMKLGEHTGWVRSLAMSGKFLFSCGCNYLRQWDTTFAVPKEVNSIKLFTGDILALAAGKKRVFTAGADGSVRSWRILDKNTGQLEEWVARPDAHEGRVCVLLLHNDKLFSSGADGIIRVWDKETLEPLGMAVAAHGGEKVHCMAMGPGGTLFTGGDDHMIRAWDPSSLAYSSDMLPANGCPLLPHHEAPVRTLAAGLECLVSGDSDGFISFWRYGPAVAAAVQAEAEAAEAAAATAAALAHLAEAAASGTASDIYTGEILCTLAAPLEDEILATSSVEAAIAGASTADVTASFDEAAVMEAAAFAETATKEAAAFAAAAPASIPDGSGSGSGISIALSSALDSAFDSAGDLVVPPAAE